MPLAPSSSLRYPSMLSGSTASQPRSLASVMRPLIQSRAVWFLMLIHRSSLNSGSSGS